MDTFGEKERRAYWTAQMEAGHDFMAAAAAYPVAECGEAIGSLTEAAREAGVEVAFSSTRTADIWERQYYLRRGLLAPFVAAARAMNRRGWVLKVEDAYRTREMQAGLSRFPAVFDRVLRSTQWERDGAIPSRELLLRRLSVLIAMRPKTGTHLSGTAMDISVEKRGSGEALDRGGPYLEMSAVTPMACPFLSPEARRNRDAITALLAEHGFVAYPFEFWHYSRGDVYGEMLARTGRPARYGAVDLDPATGRVSAMADPLAPLNTAEEVERQMAEALRRREPS